MRSVFLWIILFSTVLFSMDSTHHSGELSDDSSSSVDVHPLVIVKKQMRLMARKTLSLNGIVYKDAYRFYGRYALSSNRQRLITESAHISIFKEYKLMNESGEYYLDLLDEWRKYQLENREGF